MIEKELEDIQSLMSAIVWMVLGDGHIEMPATAKHGRFTCSHTEIHEDYVGMKVAILSCLTRATYSRYYHSRSGSYNLQIRTACHPSFTKVRKVLYLGKRKVIAPHAIKLLNPLSLAIFYQDDGRYNRDKSVISINQPLFSRLELEALAKGIVDKFGIIFRVRRSCTLKNGTQGYELALRMKDRSRFFSLIMPYVVPSMLYKITRGGSYNG